MRVRWTVLGFVLTVVVEIVVFVLVGKLIGFPLTVLAVLVTSLIGMWLLKREGVRAWGRFRAVTESGGRPGPHLTRSVVGLLGASLLTIPGFVTDLIGAVLFLPPVRALAGVGLTGLVTRRLSPSAAADLFGPRKVRVKLGKPSRDTGSAPMTSAETDATDVVEGEIVDPR